MSYCRPGFFPGNIPNCKHTVLVIDETDGPTVHLHQGTGLCITVPRPLVASLIEALSGTVSNAEAAAAAHRTVDGTAYSTVPRPRRLRCGD